MQSLSGKKNTYTLTNKEGKRDKFGVTYTGHCRETNQPVSIKTIPGSLTPLDKEKYEGLTNLNFPGLARTMEVIEHTDKYYIIREYNAGTNLKTILKTRSLHRHISNDCLLQAFIHLSKALQHLHNHGFIHRDIKPANIIFSHAPGQPANEWLPTKVVLIDFEQSTPINAPHPRAPFSMIYSPPEQLLNRSHLLCPASDVYALGITLYESIAGRAPFDDCNAEILLNLQLTYPIPQPPRMNDLLFNILHKATYKATFPKPPRLLSPTAIDDILKQGIKCRYQKAEELKTALEQYLHKSAPPKSWIQRVLELINN
ncbi:serine/threonine protein kinase [Marinilabiliaceae bacterium JC017]|nr:serine/threonine protein kinase [Marinilabiliaceae bacterium JC017]